MKTIIGAIPPDAAPQAKTLLVDDEDAGQRLDNFLMRHLKGVPKTHVYRIIRSGEVRINKGRVDADRRIAAGDLVRVPPVRTSARADAKADAMAQAGGGPDAPVRDAPAREFPILFEDDWLLAVNKPAGGAAGKIAQRPAFRSARFVGEQNSSARPFASWYQAGKP